MHWLDSTPSREIDPVLDCLTFLARRSDRPSSPVLLRAGLALSATGTLPFHQIEPALEQVGMRGEPVVRRRLSGWRLQQLPAIAELTEDRAIVLLEMKGGDALIYAPGTAEPMWVPAADLDPLFTGHAIAVEPDPTSERANERPWDKVRRTHWFWSEVWKVRREFWPVLLAALIVNMLALAVPLFTMNVYDRVIPNKAVPTLWVLAIGVFLALGFDFILRLARSQLIDEIGRRLDDKYSQKLFEKVMNLPMAERQGSTGAFAKRVSEYEGVRDFFASTSVVLVVDIAFLGIFLVLIAVIAGWLVFVPIVGIAVMLAVGLTLQRRMAQTSIDAQADSSLQHSVLVEFDLGHRDAEVGARRRANARPLAPLHLDVGGNPGKDAPPDLGRGQPRLDLPAGDQRRAGGRRLLSVQQWRHHDGRDHRHRHAGRPRNGADRPVRLPHHPRPAVDDDARFAAADDGSARRAASRGAQHRPGNPRRAPRAQGTPISAIPARASTACPASTCRSSRAKGSRSSGGSRRASRRSGRLMCGLYAPTGGEMLVDGLDSRQYHPHQLRDSFRFVGQDAELFSGSVRDNLMLGAAKADDQQMIDAVVRSGADIFLSRDAAGFDRPVGERGSLLSGGQRSLLVLARALVSPSKLLFLDEPTGAMDTQTELYFIERLKTAIAKDQTLVVSTHRHNMLSICDRLIVIDAGRIIADGPRDEVMGKLATAAKKEATK